jgi:hypothetical protein
MQSQALALQFCHAAVFMLGSVAGVAEAQPVPFFTQHHSYPRPSWSPHPRSDTLISTTPLHSTSLAAVAATHWQFWSAQAFHADPGSDGSERAALHAVPPAT